MPLFLPACGCGGLPDGRKPTAARTAAGYIRMGVLEDMEL